MTDAPPPTLAYAESTFSADFARFDRPVLFAARSAAVVVALGIIVDALRSVPAKWPNSFLEATSVEFDVSMLITVLLLACAWVARRRAIAIDGGVFARRFWAAAFAVIVSTVVVGQWIEQRNRPASQSGFALLFVQTFYVATRYAFLLLVPLLLGQPREHFHRRLLWLATVETALMCVCFFAFTLVNVTYFSQPTPRPRYVDLAEWYWNPAVLLAHPDVLLFVAATLLAAALSRSGVGLIRAAALLSLASLYLYLGNSFVRLLSFVINGGPSRWTDNRWAVSVFAFRTATLPVAVLLPTVLLAWFSFKLERDEFNGLIDQKTDAELATR